MFLAAGARLGPYEVVAPIGAGGMGEVYKARDTRLNRIVAIKVLPDRYRKDPDRQRRVEREAKAIAVAVLLAAALARVTAWEGRDQLRYSAGQVRYQKVTSSGDVVMSAISPDGRTVAYVAGAQGGDNRVLVRDVDGSESSPVWSGRDILGLGWLRDGSHLVIMGNWEKRGAWIVPVRGGPARQLTSDGKFVVASPDGASLAFTSSGLVGFHILTLANGNRRVVNLSGFRRVLAIDWHSRANRVVLMTADDDEQIYSVWSVASDGRDLSRLYTGNEYLRAMCTSPVSDVVYVMVQRRGAMDLIRIPMYSEPGPARVLVSGLDIAAMGYRCTVSADGRRLLFGRRTLRSNLWRMELPPSKTQATPLTSGTDNLWFPAVSPDGQWIAASRGSFHAPELVKLPIAGGESTSLGEGGAPAWSADGQRLAFTSRRSGSLRVWISGASGQRAQEVKDSAVGEPRPIWLPDGRLAWQTPDGQNYRIRDLSTGGDEYLFKNGAGGTWASDAVFSPRGDHVVLRRDRSKPWLTLVSLSDHSERRLALTQSIGWSKDGEWIYAIVSGDGSLVRLSSRTGMTEALGQPPAGGRVHMCDLTPDRRAVVCNLTEERSDAWLMFNFDPGIS
jgi:Tol biopolymer transport system component